MERPLFPRETLDDISIKLDEIATNTNDLNVGSDLSVAHLGSIEGAPGSDRGSPRSSDVGRPPDSGEGNGQGAGHIRCNRAAPNRLSISRDW
jgi:hypothetical protein